MSKKRDPPVAVAEDKKGDKYVHSAAPFVAAETRTEPAPNSES
jgi:hypothetical protein